MKTDKEKFMECWNDEAAWEEKQRHEARHTAYIIADIEPYESPIDGRVINSRTQRRDDLERHNSRPWEGREQESKEAKRREGYIEQKNDSQLHETVSRAYYQLPPSKRDLLRR